MLSPAEHTEKVVAEHKIEAACPARSRASQTTKIPSPTGEEHGCIQGSRWSMVDAPIYLARATSPDATCVTNWLSRTATMWAKTQDKKLEPVRRYLNATAEGP